VIKQCAWCKSFTLNGLRVQNNDRMVSGMSHGICLPCKVELVKDYTRKSIPALPRNPMQGLAVAV